MELRLRPAIPALPSFTPEPTKLNTHEECLLTEQSVLAFKEEIQSKDKLKYASLKITEIANEVGLKDTQWKIESSKGSFYIKFTSPVPGGKPGAEISLEQFTISLTSRERKFLIENSSKKEVDILYGKAKDTDKGISVRDLLGSNPISDYIRIHNNALVKVTAEAETNALLRKVVSINDRDLKLDLKNIEDIKLPGIDLKYK